MDEEVVLCEPVAAAQGTELSRWLYDVMMYMMIQNVQRDTWFFFLFFLGHFAAGLQHVNKLSLLSRERAHLKRQQTSVKSVEKCELAFLFFSFS